MPTVDVKMGDGEVKKKIVAMAALALAVGIAAGWFARRQFCGDAEVLPVPQDMRERVNRPSPPKKVSLGMARQTAMPEEHSREIDALRREVKRLEGEIAALAEKEDKGKEREYFLKSYIEKGIRTIADQKAKMPKAYKVTAENVRRQVDVLRRSRAQYDELVRSLDISLLSESGRETHERFLGHLDKFGDGFSRAEAALVDEGGLFKTYACDILDAMDEQRKAEGVHSGEQVALTSLAAWKRAKEMGLSDDDAAAVAETMRTIHEATAIQTF